MVASRCRLTFLLPETLAFAVREGVQHPCLHGCLVTIGRAGHVTVTGQSRQRIFDQTTRFLRSIGAAHPPVAIAATLITPAEVSFAPGWRDSWTITLNADVSFAPTGMGADIPAPEPLSDSTHYPSAEPDIIGP